MASAKEFIYKPETRKGPVIITPDKGDGSPPQIKLADGTVITAVRGDQRGGVFEGHHGFQWVFGNEVLGQQNATLIIGGKEQKLDNTNLSYRGASLGSLQPSSKGAVGGGAGATSGNTGGFGTAGVGEFGIAPEFIGDKFPKANLAPNPTDTFNFIDPMKFAETYSPFIRGESNKNFQQGREQALGAIETELQGLINYVPKSAQLKRDQTAQDNTFNQAQRTQQLQSAVPDVLKDLDSVASDARAYASGRAPDDVINNALEIGTRSASADVAATSGFGVRSSAARKLSDLQSARERIDLSKYGEGLLSQNAAQRADLKLAPTEYSNAGQQINVAPSISGSQLQGQFAGNLDQQTLISGTNAFGQTIQQSEFITGLQSQTDQFNANNLNNFALSYFSYLNSYVNSLAGAGQTSANTGLSLDQQEAALNRADDEKNNTQHSNDIKSGIGAAGTVIGGIVGAFSDERLKESIEKYSDGLAAILKLNPVSFRYKKDSLADDGGVDHVGVIAQEIEKVFPSLVSDHASGNLMVNGSELIYVLVGAVQELTARLIRLEERERIASLEGVTHGIG